MRAQELQIDPESGQFSRDQHHSWGELHNDSTAASGRSGRCRWWRVRGLSPSATCSRWAPWWAPARPSASATPSARRPRRPPPARTARAGRSAARTKQQRQVPSWNEIAATLAGSGRRARRRRPYEHSWSSQRQGLEDVRATADAAVEEHR